MATLSLTLPQSVFAHAACLNNGGHGAYAGVGLYFGPSDPRNGVEVPLPYGKQTHNRAYIYAAYRALQIVYCTMPLGHKPVRVLTCSKYLVCASCFVDVIVNFYLLALHRLIVCLACLNGAEMVG